MVRLTKKFNCYYHQNSLFNQRRIYNDNRRVSLCELRISISIIAIIVYLIINYTEMAFYDLSKKERAILVEDISKKLLAELQTGKEINVRHYFSDEDTYIRKSAYLSMGRIYFAYPPLQSNIIRLLNLLLQDDNFKIRQTAINAAGEIGKINFEIVQPIFDISLFDKHYAPRNAVIGSIKKMGAVNPYPVLGWAKKYLHHSNPEIRREICHGIELRGRTHPEDILPLLQELQFDTKARVRNNLIHVIGQIAYKKGCLKTVITHLKTWKNKELVQDALEEIIDVHERYKDFSFFTTEQAKLYISTHF